MGIFQLFYHLYIIELDVEVLVDRFQRSTDLYVVLELDGDFVVDQCLEEAICGKCTLAQVQQAAERGGLDRTNLKKSILKRGIY
jgi:hypothetical protein